mmetsp:Transcript_21525/g.41776  ORF Transcript_21525/g.41776 Transcript_21525/m.41776 type:complete len:203 (-) Transcript_21525:92-700(-)
MSSASYGRRHHRMSTSSMFPSDTKDSDAVNLIPSCGGSVVCSRRLLSWRSSYFSAMFSSKMVEAKAYHINIEQIDFKQLVSMIHWVHVGDLPRDPKTKRWSIDPVVLGRRRRRRRNPMVLRSSKHHHHDGYDDDDDDSGFHTSHRIVPSTRRTYESTSLQCGANPCIIASYPKSLPETASGPVFWAFLLVVVVIFLFFFFLC